MALPRLRVGTLQVHQKKTAPSPKPWDTLAVHCPLVLVASWAVRGHRSGRKHGQRSKGAPRGPFP